MNAVVILLLACLAVQDQKASQPDTTAIDAGVYEGWYKAEVNVRYHDEVADSYAIWDRTTRISTLALSMLALAGPFVVPAWKKRWLAVAFTATAISVSLNILPLNDRYRDHAIALKRWTSLAAEWDQLKRDREVLPVLTLEARLSELKGEEVSIEDDEPVGTFRGIMNRVQESMLGVELKRTDDAT